MILIPIHCESLGFQKYHKITLSVASGTGVRKLAAVAEVRVEEIGRHRTFHRVRLACGQRSTTHDRVYARVSSPHDVGKNNIAHITRS